MIKKRILTLLAFLLIIPLVSAATTTQTTQAVDILKAIGGGAMDIASLGFFTFGAFLGAGAGTVSILFAIFLFFFFWYLLYGILYDFAPFSKGTAKIISLCFVSVFAISKVIGWLSDRVYKLLSSIGKLFTFLSLEQATVIIGILLFILLYSLMSWLFGKIAKIKRKEMKNKEKIKEEAGKTFLEKISDAFP